MGTTLALQQVRHSMEGRVEGDVRPRLEALMRRYRPRVYAVCVRATGDPELAARVTRRALRHLWFSLAGWHDRERSRPRILELARRVAFEAVRRPGELLVQDGVVAGGSAAEQRLLSLSWAHRSRLVRQALAAVDPPLRDAARLRYLENLPHRAIASWLGDPDAPRSLERDRARLRSEMARVFA